VSEIRILDFAPFLAELRLAPRRGLVSVLWLGRWETFSEGAFQWWNNRYTSREEVLAQFEILSPREQWLWDDDKLIRTPPGCEGMLGRSFAEWAAGGPW
jgi:hypothetical protein